MLPIDYQAFSFSCPRDGRISSVTDFTSLSWTFCATRAEGTLEKKMEYKCSLYGDPKIPYAVCCKSRFCKIVNVNVLPQSLVTDALGSFVIWLPYANDSRLGQKISDKVCVDYGIEHLFVRNAFFQYPPYLDFWI